MKNVMENENDKVDDILNAVKKQVKYLQSKRISGRMKVTVEVNFSQGGIGDSYLILDSREKI